MTSFSFRSLFTFSRQAKSSEVPIPETTQVQQTFRTPEAILGGWPDLPDYEILEKLGEGGMGVVYRARHRKLDRVVALKMILYADPGLAAVKSFQLEGEAVARLNHSNVVQIYEFGEYRGQPYFTMEYCPGGSLAARLTGNPIAPNASAELIASLADAMHSAHSVGIVHRDLKPLNVLLANGETSPGHSAVTAPRDRKPRSVLLAAGEAPKISDFGLAKRLGGEFDQLKTNALCGTPQYMSPEQAVDAKHVGPAADQWSLGVMLYELLTGNRPFVGLNPMEILLQVTQDDPRPPRVHVPRLPIDLETICLKCLEKNPEQRYASCADLASDLRNYLQHRPISARPASHFEKALKWTRRNPLKGLLYGGGTLAALALLLLGLWFTHEVECERDATKELARQRGEMVQELTRSRDDLQQSEGRVRRSLWETERTLINANVMLSQKASTPEKARRYLNVVPPEQRQWEWHYLSRKVEPGSYSLYGHTGSINRLAYSPDGRFLVSASDDGTARVWDARTGEAWAEFRGHAGAVTGVAVSPDSQRIATCGDDQTLRVCDASGNQIFQVSTSHPLLEVEFSPDGSKIGTLADSELELWAASDGTAYAKFELSNKSKYYRNQATNSRRFQFDPRGQWVLAIDGGEALRCWEIHTGKEVKRGLESGGIYHYRIDPSGSRAYVSSPVEFRTGGPEIDFSSPADLPTEIPKSTNQLVTLDGRRLRNFDTDFKGVVAFSPDGHLLAGWNDQSQSIQLRDALYPRRVAAAREPEKEVFDVGVFGKLLEPERGDRPIRQAGIRDLIFHPSGSVIATGSRDGTIAITSVRELLCGPTSDPMPMPPAEGKSIFPSWGRPRQSTYSRRGEGADTLEIKWEEPGVNAEFVQLSGDGETTLYLCHSPDRKQTDYLYLRSNRTPGKYRWLPINLDRDLSGKVTSVPLFSSYLAGVFALSHDGSFLAEWTAERVVVRDLKSGRISTLATEPKRGVDRILGFSRDAEVIAIAKQDRVVIFNTTSGEKTCELSDVAKQGGSAFAFHPGSKQAAIMGEQGEVRIFDLLTTKCVQVLSVDCKSLHDIQFVRDGAMLLTLGSDGCARLWDLTTGKERLAIRPTDDGTGQQKPLATMSPSGDRLATSVSGKLELWDLVTGQQVYESPTNASARAMRFFADGSGLIVVENWGVRVLENRPAEVVELRNPENISHGVLFSPDGLRIADLGDRTVRIRNSRTGEVLSQIASPQDLNAPVERLYYRDGSWSISQTTSLAPLLSPDWTVVLLVAGPSKLQINDVSTGELLWRLNVPSASDGQDDVAFSPDGHYLAIWAAPLKSKGVSRTDPLMGEAALSPVPDIPPDVVPSLRLFESRTGKLVGEFHPPAISTEAKHSVRFSVTGRRVFLTSETGMQYGWDLGGERTSPSAKRVDVHDTYVLREPKSHGIWPKLARHDSRIATAEGQLVRIRSISGMTERERQYRMGLMKPAPWVPGAWVPPGYCISMTTNATSFRYIQSLYESWRWLDSSEKSFERGDYDNAFFQRVMAAVSRPRLSETEPSCDPVRLCPAPVAADPLTRISPPTTDTFALPGGSPPSVVPNDTLPQPSTDLSVPNLGTLPVSTPRSGAIPGPGGVVDPLLVSPDAERRETVSWVPGATRYPMCHRSYGRPRTFFEVYILSRFPGK